MQAQKKIFPHEVVEFSLEKHFRDYNPRTRNLYITILIITGVAFLLLFIIKVDITVRSTGSISPIQGRTELRTPISGILDSVYIKENEYVRAGQQLMKIHSQSLSGDGASFRSQHQELWDQAEDLKNILAGKTDSFRTSLYNQQYAYYQQKLNDAQNRYDLVNKNFSRYSSLYRSRVISAEEYDKYDYEKKAVESQIDLIREQQFSQWQAELARLNQQLQDNYATVTAPVSGYVLQLKSTHAGAVVSSNDILGEISPDSGLVAEAYVFPKDIGLLHIGTPVSMQVDAFDYNVWGMLKGKILSISNDVFTDGGHPYFKVRCKLDKQMLRLKNGYTGYVKNGMTLQARFIITKRTLFQLLYDKTDDWLNPNLVKSNNNAQTNG